MATIDYEKKYKEALEKARQLCAYPTTKPFISDLQDLFPELAESEDEKVRKEIITYISTADDKELIPYDSWISWLEKQGKMKEIIPEDATVDSNEDGLIAETIRYKNEKQGEQSKKHDVCDTCDEKDSCISPCCVKLVEEQGRQKPVGFNIGDEITVNGQVCRVVAVDNPAWSEEVDLEKEMQVFAKMELEPLKIYDDNIGISITMSQLYSCARHFFKLGLQAQKEK